MAEEPVENNQRSESEDRNGGRTSRDRDGETRNSRDRDRREDRDSDDRGQRPRSGRPQGGSRPYQRGGGRYQPRRKVCVFCADKNRTIDWKNPDGFRRFIGDSGEIFPRRKTGLCARHQRGVAVAIKRARHLALLPFTSDHIRIMSRS